MALVSRDRLKRSINDSALRGVALVIAPAGYGKSEAVADAVGDLGIIVDFSGSMAATPDAAATSLIAALNPRAARPLAYFLQRPASDDRDAELAAWVSARLRDVDVPIVLDDFQKLNAIPSVRIFFERVIESTVPRTRWIIASRELPDLPVGTWMAHGLMALPLSTADLAFTLGEATALAEALGVSIGTADLEAIIDDAEGWPLVVRLALGAWERTQALIPLRIRTQPVLHDFIESQVWSEVDPDDHRLLLAAALLEYVTPGLLGEVGFEGAAQRLDRLHRRIPLLQLRSTGQYRLHDTFRDFILERHADKATKNELVLSTVGALVRFGAYARAIELAVHSHAWEIAFDLLGTHGSALVAAGERSTVSSALAGLPRQLRERPIAIALRGILHASDGANLVAESDLRAAVESTLLPRALRTRSQLLLAQFAINRGKPNDAVIVLTKALASDLDETEYLEALTMTAGAYAAAGDTTHAQEFIARSLERLDSVGSEARGRALGRLAFSALYIGDYGAAESRAAEAVEIAEANGVPSLAARGYSVLQAVATMVHTDTSMAAHYARAWAAAGKESGEKATHSLGLVSLVMVSADRGDDEQYETAVAELRLHGPPSARHTLPLRIARVFHEAGAGRFREAATALTTIATDGLSSSGRAVVDSLLGVLYATADEHDRAEALLRRPNLSLAVEDLESRRFMEYSSVYRSLGLWLLGRAKVAQRSLGPQARDLPEQDILVLAVMRSICTTPRATMTHKKLDLLTAPLVAVELDGIARFLRALFRPAASELLTRTELDVLRELRRGGTTAEIADRLGRSPKTVNWHIDGACRKIGCSGRGEALAYAIDRGWLD